MCPRAGRIEKRTRERSQDRMLNTPKSWGSQIGNADESQRDHTFKPSRDTATRGSTDQLTVRRNPTQLSVRAQTRHSWAHNVNNILLFHPTGIPDYD
ncbi:BZ3500_MvSof-1268-A1-R1_Chr8-1g09962 [Microbotryum saponariae]|uniref:BZ3500_MvSof-1268-A1-R1_Chr8-1g09962 protein n=1 Tax=Microbotryum saponariae TaxID=289078 RepID=A0A2X0LRW4_9BASI|nr:BZ3500_MvSof-1268-A1-R1_Chr8-1g09962 [Microbotryum saponariae]SDA08248.1 BZ3501_MvSof-1269-A2-R1_Chr8-1g09685 [Microbotryum saponariae]